MQRFGDTLERRVGNLGMAGASAIRTTMWGELFDPSFLYMIIVLGIPAGLPSDASYLIGIFSISFLYLAYKRRFPLSLAYVFFGLIFVLYFFLSYFEFFAEGQFYLSSMVIRQSAQYFVFFALFPACVVAAGDFIKGDGFRKRLSLATVVLFILALVLWRSENVILGFRLYGTMAVALSLELFLIFLIFVSFPDKILRTVLLIVLFFFMGAATNQLIVVFAILLSVVEVPEVGLFAVVLFSVALTILVANASPELVVLVYSYDPNSAVRFQFWQHAISEIVRGHFLGSGFGGAWHSGDAAVNPYTAGIFGNTNRLFTVANHNSFIDVTLRMGIPGLFAFLFLIFSTWPRNAQGVWKLLCAVALASILLSCFFDPAFESVRAETYLIFALALLRAHRDRATQGHVKATGSKVGRQLGGVVAGDDS